MTSSTISICSSSSDSGDYSLTYTAYTNYASTSSFCSPSSGLELVSSSINLS